MQPSTADATGPTLGPQGHVLVEPPPEPDPIRLPDPTSPLLARLDLDRVEGDLTPVHVQPNAADAVASAIPVAERDTLARQSHIRDPAVVANRLVHFFRE